MSKKKLPASAVLLALIVISVLNVISLSFPANAQATPTIYIDPQLTTTNINATFSVDLDITAAKDVCSWQAYIYYKNDVLEAVSYFERPFLNSHGSTLFDGGFDNNYNQTYGQLWMYCLRTWNGYGVDGDGILATITLRAKMGGTSPLNLADTVLGNSTAQGIDHTTTDGQVDVGAHDVSIISVDLGKTIVGQGYSMRINVTVANQGNYPETFNVTSYANTSSIATQTVTLSNGSSTILTFTWDTSGFAKGNCTIWAYAWPVSGETDTADNAFTDGIIKVSCIGDIDGTYSTTMLDYQLVKRAIPSVPGDPKWNPNADINNDGVVNMLDFQIVKIHVGEHA